MRWFLVFMVDIILNNCLIQNLIPRNNRRHWLNSLDFSLRGIFPSYNQQLGTASKQHWKMKQLEKRVNKYWLLNPLASDLQYAGNALESSDTWIVRFSSVFQCNYRTHLLYIVQCWHLWATILEYNANQGTLWHLLHMYPFHSTPNFGQHMYNAVRLIHD